MSEVIFTASNGCTLGMDAANAHVVVHHPRRAGTAYTYVPGLFTIEKRREQADASRMEAEAAEAYIEYLENQADYADLEEAARLAYKKAGLFGARWEHTTDSIRDGHRNIARVLRDRYRKDGAQ